MAIVTLLLTHAGIKEIIKKVVVVVLGVTKINFGCTRGGAGGGFFGRFTVWI